MLGREQDPERKEPSMGNDSGKSKHGVRSRRGSSKPKRSSSETFGLIDLFAGPGGLGEGFSHHRADEPPLFVHAISVEKEKSAHQTLVLRAFLRKYKARHGGKLPPEFVEFHAQGSTAPAWEEIDRKAWLEAVDETPLVDVGTANAKAAIKKASMSKKGKYDETVVIGGPPCQAYSLAGRSRLVGDPSYVPEDDKRSYLFREYIDILRKTKPAAFVMENVKGMLSSTLESRLVFDMLMEDLSSLGSRREHQYEIRAIRVENGKAQLIETDRPPDFVVRAEQFGIPQRRHRVFIVGIRSDLARGASAASIDLPGCPPTVKQAIGNLPVLRSGLSQDEDGIDDWRETVVLEAKELAGLHSSWFEGPFKEQFELLANRLNSRAPKLRSSGRLPRRYGESEDGLMAWIENADLRAIAQHETRGHMASDLGRYMFSAVFANLKRASPKASDFPIDLSPNHQNWHSGAFSDRFRVQLKNEPSATITSHISKDGHYFIHYDPLQCRSLTVREAARLQTFPDDYYFLGNRTQQYVQVGNAVPPLLANRIAELLHKALSAT